MHQDRYGGEAAQAGMSKGVDPRVPQAPSITDHQQSISTSLRRMEIYIESLEVRLNLSGPTFPGQNSDGQVEVTPTTATVALRNAHKAEHLAERLEAINNAV